MSQRDLLLTRRNGPSLSALFVGWAARNISFSRVQTTQNVSYYAENGLLCAVSGNVPRFEYRTTTRAGRGLLIEPQATNLALYSTQPYTYWSYSNYDKIFYGQTFGVFTNAVIVTSAGATWHRITTAYTATEGVLLYWQAFVIAGTSGKILIEHRVGSSSTLLTGTIGNTLTATNTSAGTVTYLGIEDVGNGIKRIYGTFLPNYSSAYTLGVGPYSATAGETIVVLGGQVETSRSTSLILTGSSATTRAADVLSFTVPPEISTIRYTFDTGGTQDVAASAGTTTVPTNLNAPHIMRVQGL